MKNNKINIYQPVSICEIGQRTNNEDQIYPSHNHASEKDKLFLVCDGVGGAANGEIASTILCETISQFLNSVSGDINKQVIERSIRFAEEKLESHKTAFPDSAEMASTLTLLSLQKNRVFVAWAGDSRVYHIRRGNIIFQTEDHSLVSLLVRQGRITEAEARNHPKRNQIFRAVSGTKNITEVEIVQLKDLEKEDYFFMCTDGILEQITNQELSYLFSGKLKLEDIIEKVYEICHGKTKDNYSCYIIQIKDVSNSFVYGSQTDLSMMNLINPRLYSGKFLQAIKLLLAFFLFLIFVFSIWLLFIRYMH
jgi:serine/threonine protein phosphatase PrpC